MVLPSKWAKATGGCSASWRCADPHVMNEVADGSYRGRQKIFFRSWLRWGISPTANAK